MSNTKFIGEYLIVIIFLISFICIFQFETTGNTSDSLGHYFFARYAFEFPSNFLNHWAKPLFTFIAAPFAQFGINGVKFLNLILACVSSYFCYRIAQEQKKETAWFTIILCFFAPLFFAKIFSALTEHLFAALMMISLYLLKKEKWTWGVIIYSFLPLSRSEGLVLFVPFATYLIISKRIRYMPLLATGQLLVNVIGAFYYGDFFWVFTKIPYSYEGSIYGHGEWSHFLERVPFVTGIPIYVYLWIGILILALRLLKNLRLFVVDNENNLFDTYLIYGCYLAFFVAHSIFWWQGIFGSFGILRVFNAVIPLISLISLDGINYIIAKTPAKGKIIIQVTLWLTVLGFPFINNPHALNFKKDLHYTHSEALAKNDIPMYLKEIGVMNSENLITENIYFSGIELYYWLNVNPFPWGRMTIREFINHYKPDEAIKPTYFIWDSWHDPLEFGVPLEKLTSIPGMKIIKEFRSSETEKVSYILLKLN